MIDDIRNIYQQLVEWYTSMKHRHELDRTERNCAEAELSIRLNDLEYRARLQDEELRMRFPGIYQALHEEMRN